MQQKIKFYFLILISIVLFFVNCLHMRIAEQDNIFFTVNKCGNQLRILNDNIDCNNVVFYKNEIQLDQQKIKFSVDQQRNQILCTLTNKNNATIEWSHSGSIHSLSCNFSIVADIEDLNASNDNSNSLSNSSLVNSSTSSASSFTPEEEQVLVAALQVYFQAKNIYRTLFILGCIQLLLFLMCYILLAKKIVSDKILILPTIFAFVLVVFMFL